MIPVKIRAKGQMTLPASVRAKLDVREGDTVYLRDTEHGVEVINASQLQDPARGMLRQYATVRNPDSTEERQWAARSIAEGTDHDEP